MRLATVQAVANPRRDDLVLADAIIQHAMAMRSVAKAIEDGNAQRKDADEFWGAAGFQWTHTCAFLKRKGPWLLASVPGVLMAIGAITPNLAGLLAKIIANVTGVHP